MNNNEHEKAAAPQDPATRDDEQPRKDVLYRVDQAAGILASEQWPDTPANRLLAYTSWEMRYPNDLPPLLDGKVTDSAYVAQAKGDAETEIASAIQKLVDLKLLTLRSPNTFLPTQDPLGAWISRSQLLQLLREGAHLATTNVAAVRSTVQMAAAEESAQQRQERRYQMCVRAGLEVPDDDYAHLPRGIGELAKQEGISRQAFSEDVKAHIKRLKASR